MEECIFSVLENTAIASPEALVPVADRSLQCPQSVVSRYSQQKYARDKTSEFNFTFISFPDGTTEAGAKLGNVSLTHRTLAYVDAPARYPEEPALFVSML